MATPLSHLAVPLALSAALGGDRVSSGLLALALAASLLPDIDALGLWLGVPYAHAFGHRGFTHSLPFAALLAAATTPLAPAVGADRALTFLLLFVGAASHGLLDAMTNGGLGVALFSPFSQRRMFLPWRVIEVSPLRPSALFSRRGLDVLRSELRWVWVPCMLAALAAIALRRLSG